MVDTVLYFEGDTHSAFRLVRDIKNRFGAVNEIGVFAMTEKGLKGVSNPSAIFLSRHSEPVPGSCVMVTLEGTRPMLVEIQALVDPAHTPNARRLSVGLEANRLAMLLAVLHRHAGVERVWSVPDNVDAVDAALMAGRALIEVAPRSPVRTAIRAIAAELVPAVPGPRRRGQGPGRRRR